MTKTVAVAAILAALAGCASTTNTTPPPEPKPTTERPIDYRRPGSIGQATGLSTPAAIGCRLLNVARSATWNPQLGRLSSVCSSATNL